MQTNENNLAIFEKLLKNSFVRNETFKFEIKINVNTDKR